MATRIELADIADRITEHVVRDTPGDRVWPLGVIARATRDGLGTVFRFELTEGVAEPGSPELSRLAEELTANLTRHLVDRQLDPDWVWSADLTITIADGKAPEGTPVSCRLVISDDRGRVHTSTRQGILRPIAPPSRFLDRLFRRGGRQR